MKTCLKTFVILCFISTSLSIQSQNIVYPIDGAIEWQKLFLRSYKIDGNFQSYAYSSELNEVPAFEAGFGKYTILNLFDNDPGTAWVEGVTGYGEGEMIFIGLGNELPEKFILKNGYQKSEKLYNYNSRPKTIKISLYTAYFLEGEVTELASIYRIRELSHSFTHLLKDQMGSQDIPIDLDTANTKRVQQESLEVFKEIFSKNIKEVKEYCPDCNDTPDFQYLLKIEIVDVYKGSKWDDTCISDFSSVYLTKELKGIPKDDIIEDVYESDDPGSGLIYVDSNKERELILLDKSKMKENKLLEDGTSFEVILMDVSPDNEWAQVNVLFHQEGAGRVEEYSILYHVRSLSRVDTSVLDLMYGMSGFVVEDEKNWLDTVEGLIDLDKIKQKINPKK